MSSPQLRAPKKTVRLSAGFPYGVSQGLLTAYEAHFYQSLLPVSLELGLMPFPKVRMEDVIRVSLDRGDPDYQRRRNSVKSRHFDFVLCEIEDSHLRPVVAIELDDKSHWSSLRARQNDKKKNALCRQSGFELIRFPKQDHYDRERIASRVRQKMAVPSS